MNERKLKIGELLVQEGLASAGDINAAVKEQKKSGSRIGEVLLAKGILNGKQLYSTLAKHHEMLYADLLKNPCDKSLLDVEERENYVSHGVIPWVRQGDDFIIAVSNVKKETLDWVESRFDNFQLALTSPFDISHAVNSNFKRENTEDACNLLWRENPKRSARETFSLGLGQKWTKIISTATIVSMLGLIFTKPIFIVLNVFYFGTLLFKAFVFSVGLLVKNRKSAALLDFDEGNLPVYTIMVPLFKEKQKTIKQLVESIRALDYPKSKLDVKLIIEESDIETKTNIINERCERIFEIIEVPYSYPQTKPKALNYALKFAKGEYATIYDAEDRPNPAQLKEALSRLRSRKESYACAQARLNYYNREENSLTRMFAIEYASWFDCLLPGLEKLGIPIPLGGTSNHFPIRALRKLLGWDPYNVTEDADLGVRIAAEGHKTLLLDSITLEEAPVRVKNWVRQRSRWIKGHMQTYLVQVRNPQDLYNNVGAKGALGFLFFIGAPCLVFMTLPVVIISAIYMFSSGQTFPEWFINLAYFNLLAGIVLNVVFAVVVAVKNKWWGMLPHSLIFPFYWILHSIASFKAVWQLILRPHYWEKTDHGESKVLSLNNESSA